MRFLFLLLMLVSTSVFAESREAALLNKLPADLHGFMAGGGVQGFGDARLGAATGYQLIDGATKATLTIIVFDAGMGPIDDGVASPVTGKAYSMALGDIRAQERLGKYQGVKELSNGVVDLADRKAYLAHLNYLLQLDTAPGVDVHSWLVMTGLQGYMVKIRMTGNDAQFDQARALQIANTVIALLKN
ncbi:MAG: hypothetical protein K0R03_2284 [Moraxellaceae bacterium]|jgi:hypothetical protein|nr:hypothetical protein [Moraxellaceae bacterium]MDF3031726.1 hypothetical protein [Moraxellaceae bacterium]